MQHIQFSGWLIWHLALKLRQIPKVGSCMTSSTQLRDILGIADSSSAIDNAEVIRRGLSIESFKRVAGYYQLTDVQMSKVVGTSVRTIVRLQKEQKPLNAAWSDRLYRLARVAAQAQDVFESAETATNWLKRPNRALAGHSPIDLLDTDAGTEQVVELLDRIEYGVYS
jgi:putative toxin-antitoxin system antitoxin component (TIGR02293 family)